MTDQKVFGGYRKVLKMLWMFTKL